MWSVCPSFAMRSWPKLARAGRLATSEHTQNIYALYAYAWAQLRNCSTRSTQINPRAFYPYHHSMILL